MADTQSLVDMKGIAKSFPGVVALEDVDFSLRKGEIHALMGENGAGKSTLIKILTGVEHPDKGSIELEGKLVQVRSPQHSQDLGISTVYQEVNLCTNISVAENIMLGREPRRFGSSTPTWGRSRSSRGWSTTFSDTRTAMPGSPT